MGNATTTTDLEQARFRAGVELLDLGPDAPGELDRLRAAGDCAGVQGRMADLVGARLGEVESQLAGLMSALAAAGGVVAGADTADMTHFATLSRLAARLQAAAEALVAPPAAGACGPGCPCSIAAAAADSATYHLPTLAGAAPDGPPIVCTLDAIGDTSDMVARVADWRTVLAGATGREAIDDGIAVTFGHDVARAAELGRLLAAEYACCSFASYAMVIDARGTRIEIRTPPEGRDALAAVFGIAG
jgi:hypothetical protein